MRFALATIAAIVLASGVDAKGKGGKGRKEFIGTAFSCDVRPAEDAVDPKTEVKGGACFADSTNPDKTYQKFGTHFRNLDTTVTYSVGLAAACGDAVPVAALGDLTLKTHTKRDGSEGMSSWMLSSSYDADNAAPAFAAD